MKKLSFIQNYLSLAIKLILILSILNSIYNHFWHLMSTSIFLLALMFLPQIIKKYKIKLPKILEWALLVFVVFTLFLGKISSIISPIAFGIAIGFIGLLILAILYSSNQIKKNYFLITIFSFSFAVTFGTLLEILKYILKSLAGQILLRDLYNYTMKNLLFVVIGATIATIIGLIYMKGYFGIRKLSESFLKLNPRFSKKRDDEEVSELISKGESEKLEFKSTLRTNLHTNEFDKNMEYAVLKTIVGFLNTNGGTLLIGISNKEEIIGIKPDKFENADKFNLHLVNIIKEKIGKKYLHLIEIQTKKVKDKIVIKLYCKKSTKEVFLKITPKQEEFHIRVGPSTTQLIGSELLDYVEKRFKK